MPTRAELEATYKARFEAALGGVRLKVVLVTPAMAMDWLTRNTLNRRLCRRNVSRWCETIARGRWQVNGETVVFAADGTLLDGQNRLTAIAESGVAVPLLVVSGVSTEAFSSFNQGKVRSWAEVLFISGVKQKETALASALRWRQKYDALAMLYPPKTQDNAEALLLLEKYPGMPTSVEYVWAHKQKGVHQPGPWAFLHNKCMERNPEHAAFFEQVLTGAGLVEGTPAHRLYQWLTGAGNKGRKIHQQTVEMLALAIKAWNATVSGSRLGKLGWVRKAEDFPVIL